MPLLVLLSLAALAVLVRRQQSPAMAALRWPALGTVIIGGAVLGYGYLANRYTSDFVPGLIVMGAIGLWGMTSWRWPQTGVVRTLVPAVMICLCTFSLLAQMATGSLVAAQTARGDQLVSFMSLQERLSGGLGTSLDKKTSRSDGMPVGGTADDLHIIGDCEALFVNTGDQYEPWNVVEQRDMTVEVTPTFIRYKPGTYRLFEQNGIEDRYISLEFDTETPQARLVVEDRDGNFYSPWFETARGRKIRVTAHTQPDVFDIRIRINDNSRYDLHLPVAEWNTEWYNELTRLAFLPTHDGGSREHISVSNRWGRAPALCDRVAANASSLPVR